MSNHKHDDTANEEEPTPGYLWACWGSLADFKADGSDDTRYTKDNQGIGDIISYIKSHIFDALGRIGWSEYQQNDQNDSNPIGTHSDKKHDIMSKAKVRLKSIKEVWRTVSYLWNWWEVVVVIAEHVSEGRYGLEIQCYLFVH